MEPVGPVLDVVLPVYGLIAAGWAALRAGFVDADGVRRFTDFTFRTFVPAQLFLAMARTDFGALQAGVPAAYFSAALAVFAAVVLVRRRHVEPVRAAVEGLAASFGNTVMIGIPLVKLGWGDAGLALLLSIVALHSLLMLTSATLVFEVASASDAPGAAVGRTVRSALTNPVIVPILIGAAWSAAGLPLPAAADATLSLLAQAASPLCLVLLGASLGRGGLRSSLRPALAMSAMKLLAFPLVAGLVGRHVIGLPPLALSVVVLTAALPIGANVFLFAQRYRTDTTVIAAAVVWSTLLAAPILAGLLLLLPEPPR
ncbi:MAG: AEC family transporter [Burkholderiales bacterium]|jgi:predicted permease